MSSSSAETPKVTLDSVSKSKTQWTKFLPTDSNMEKTIELLVESEYLPADSIARKREAPRFVKKENVKIFLRGIGKMI